MSRFIPRNKVAHERTRQGNSKMRFVNDGLKSGSLVKWPDAEKGPYIMAKEKAEELTRFKQQQTLKGDK